MNDKLKPSKRVIVYEEFIDDSAIVSDNDIREYSQRLGIDLTVNPTLATSVRDWILQPLPRYWFPCLDTQTGHWFYSNSLNGQSTWYHPLEEIHRNLAKEFFSSQTILGAERENPEGESAEQSMESGFSTKGFGSLSSSITGGVSPIRNPLPRALAPLKRIPKVEPTTNSLATPTNPLPPFRSSNLHNEHVREVSFSTFKSGDPISSLLPGDILFENRDRPTTIVTPFNHSVIPLSTTDKFHSTSIDNRLEDYSHHLSTSQMKEIPRYPSAGKGNISPLTIDQSTSKELATSFVSNSEQEPSVQQPKPRVSFTERLAAKKASQRLKSNESSESCLSNPIESDQTSAIINSEKKHVHFDLKPNQFRNYTPESSEENKAVDKSPESSSSEDILDLVGDPEFLKPLTDVKCYPATYEEKRWEVSFTSFGLNSANGSPIKVSYGFVDNEEGSNEMVTRFNSEYCPSPLPVSEKSEDVGIEVNETAIPTNHFENQTENEAERHSTVSELIFELNAVPEVLPVIETDVPTLCENTTTQNIILPFHDEFEKKDKKREINPSEVVFSEVPITDRSMEENTAKAVKEISTSSPISSKLTVELPPVENANIANLATKSRTPKLIRSLTRSESLEKSILPEQFNPPIVPKVPPCLDSIELVTSEIKSVEPQHHFVQSDDELHINQEPSQLHLLLPPAPFSQIIPQIATCTEETVADSIQNKNDDISDAAQKASETKNLPLEDWLMMKREMESALEIEKKKLESWFSSEIAQIKKQFENELASERQRTENLSRLVENAKSEKEELAKREIIRLEETLSHLVEEKTRQVQTRLNSEILQNNSVSLLQRSVERQDANVQTEETSIPVNSLPTEQMAPLLKDGETGTSESNPWKNETYSRWESRDSPPPRRDSRIQCQCDSLQKQVARVEREMQLLKQKNLSFQKNPSTRKKSTPVKAQREPWWLDTDESVTSTTSSVSDWRHSRGRSRSMTNLHATGEVSSGRKSTPNFQRARNLLSRSQTPRRMWMEDLSTDHSMVDIPTSGISSAISTGEWDTVLSSIQKISGDLQEVWSHIGPRPRPLSYLSYQSSLWMPTQSSSQSFIINDRVPLHWSFSGSTAERTQALKLWLQQNKTQYSKPLL